MYYVKMSCFYWALLIVKRVIYKICHWLKQFIEVFYNKNKLANSLKYPGNKQPKVDAADLD